MIFMKMSLLQIRLWWKRKSRLYCFIIRWTKSWRKGWKCRVITILLILPIIITICLRNCRSIRLIWKTLNWKIGRKICLKRWKWWMKRWKRLVKWKVWFCRICLEMWKIFQIIFWESIKRFVLWIKSDFLRLKRKLWKILRKRE